MGGCAAAYFLELIVCILVRVRGWDSLWLCYVNPLFRIFGEGFAGILICEFLRNHDVSDKYEWLAVVLFLGAFLIRNLHLNILSAWIQLIPMGCVILAFRSGTGAVSRVLKGKAFQFLGTISFELYMTHAFVYEGLPIAVGVVNKAMRSWLIAHAGTRFVITFILCIVVAWIVKLFMDWVNRKIVYRS